jgi:hypothetical protein
MNNPTFEILSDAGEVLASLPLPGEALIEAREGEVKEFSLAAEVERDGHAGTFRGRDAGGQVIAEGRAIQSRGPHVTGSGLLHLDRVDLKRGERVTLKIDTVTVTAGIEQ